MRWVLIPDNEEAERKKFASAEEILDDHEALVLQGWRQIKAVAQVRNMLKSLAKGTDADAIASCHWRKDSACFFFLVGLTPCFEQCHAAPAPCYRFGPKCKSLMDPAKIKKILHIYERISDAGPEADRLILDLDERFGSGHCMPGDAGYEDNSGQELCGKPLAAFVGAAPSH